MHAIILAGGKGTRLRPFTMTIPKPLLPLGDVPVLEIVISQLAAAGFSRVTLTLSHMAPIFEASLGDGSKWGLKLDYLIEDTPLGTAGSLRLVSNPEPRVLVMNGDLLTTFPYVQFMAEAEKTGACAAVAVHQREVKIDYGVVEYAPDGHLTAYREKPVIPYAVSMGINIVTQEALEFIPRQGKFDMPDLMLTLRGAGKRVLCFPTDCYWQDIGRFDDYQRASDDFTATPGRFLPAPPSGPPAGAAR